MNRLIALLVACLLVLSMGVSAVAHTIEPAGCVDGVELSADHADGDADQGLGDSGKATPHHHGGCHGHHVSTAPDALAVVPYFPTPALAPLHSFAGLPRSGTGPALRPPIA